MLRSIKTLKGYRIEATDGEIGKVDELFFDEVNWKIRYLVIELGSWLFGRRALIAPEAVEQIDVEKEHILMSLTKQLIKESPDVSADEPISQEKERALHEHYKWMPYWIGGVGDPVHAYKPAGLTGTYYIERNKPTKDEPTEKEQLKEAGTESRLRSTSEVIGYSIQASDDTIGHVTDFIIDDQEWVIRDLVVDTGKWLSGREVLVAPPWIERISWGKRKVYVTMTKESVRQSPRFDADILDIDEYEKQLLDYYKDWFSDHVLSKAQ